MAKCLPASSTDGGREGLTGERLCRRRGGWAGGRAGEGRRGEDYPGPSGRRRSEARQGKARRGAAAVAGVGECEGAWRAPAPPSVSVGRGGRGEETEGGSEPPPPSAALGAWPQRGERWAARPPCNGAGEGAFPQPGNPREGRGVASQRSPRAVCSDPCPGGAFTRPSCPGPVSGLRSRRPPALSLSSPGWLRWVEAAAGASNGGDSGP